MTAQQIVIGALLSLSVLCCWVGCVGMWRMSHPTQALHYTGLPGTLGVTALVAAVFVQTGNSPVAWKSVLIAAVVLAVNSAGVHAVARAFRTRALGHWQPRDGDQPLEKLRETGEGAP